jgi:hypothetical protein
MVLESAGPPHGIGVSDEQPMHHKDLAFLGRPISRLCGRLAQDEWMLPSSRR